MQKFKYYVSHEGGGERRYNCIVKREEEHTLVTRYLGADHIAYLAAGGEVGYVQVCGHSCCEEAARCDGERAAEVDCGVE